MTVHTGRWTRDDRALDQWPRLPFEVPSGSPGVRVSLSYDTSGGAVVDLGCEGAAGWRGWSGGARSWYVITPSAATPGYLPGELEPGLWHVVLGLHRIPAGGVPYRVEIDLAPAAASRLAGPPPGVAGWRGVAGWPEVPAPPGGAGSHPAATPGRAESGSPSNHGGGWLASAWSVGSDGLAGPPPGERPPARELPAEPGLRWLACDFHAHTVHSDGALTVPELAARAAARGLDVLAVTDHNTVSHFASLPGASARYGVHLLPGQEITTDLGHANAFGELPWIDFRQPAVTWRTAVEAAGGVLSVNHPLTSDHGWAHPLDRPPAVAEVWHWTWLDRRWTGPLAWWRAAGMHVVPIGGSDFHRPDEGTELGAPVTWVAAEAASTEAVLGALRAGRTAVSAHRDGPALLRLGDELVALDADGALLLGPDGARHPVRSARCAFPATPGGYALMDPDGTVLALTS